MALGQTGDTISLTEADCRRWLDGYKDAWERQDEEAIVRIFTEDASYRENRFGTPLRGAEQIRAYWKRTVGGFQRDVSFHHEFWGTHANQCIATWNCTFEWSPINGVIELDGMFRLTFSNQRNPEGIPLCTVFEEWYEYREV